MRERIILDNVRNNDGIDRRGFLQCMAWAGTGVLWAMSGGVIRSYGLSRLADPRAGGLSLDALTNSGDFTFVQISDSHIGFAKEANPDVVGTLQSAIVKINAIPSAPSFILHTGDLSHLSKPSEFDTLDQVLRGANAKTVFYVPGEHDVLTDDGKQFLDRYGKGTKGSDWYSFDDGGAHFVGLVNVLNLKPGGLGTLGAEQLAWLQDDLKGQSASTPIVVFAHVPLWSVYPDWGWGTDDAAQALSYLKRFGSVTVLNGHIHQTLQKIEGNITFHTAMSTAFPQPAPGSAPSPGPMKVPAEKLRTILGITSVMYTEGSHSLALVDSPLDGTAQGDSPQGDSKSPNNQKNRPAAGANVEIDNFTFTPRMLTVQAGTTVTWTNHDDVPHTVVSTKKKFSSPVLDTDQTFSFTFSEAGTFDYFCSIHSRMTGTVIVK